MKRYILAAATALPLLYGPALAKDAPTSMVRAVQDAIDANGFSADATTLTDAQLAAIYVSANSEMSANDIKLQIESALDMDMNEMAASRATTDAVQNILDRMGYEADASTLDDAQLTQIYLAANGQGSVSEKRAKIEAVMPGMKMSGGMNMNMDMDMMGMSATVQDILQRDGFDVDVATLSDDQMAQIYLAATSGNSPAERKAKIEAALQP